MKGVVVNEHITQDTRMFTTTPNGFVVIAKGRVCYLAKYNSVTKVGVIFLCTSSPAKPHRYLIVASKFLDLNGRPLGILVNQPFLKIDPLIGFSSSFYLNFSHAFKVQCLHVSHYRDVLQILPPAVDFRSLVSFVPDPGSQDPGPIPVLLDFLFERVFLEFNWRYHKARPRLPSGEDKSDEDGLKENELSSKDLNQIWNDIFVLPVLGTKASPVTFCFGNVRTFRLGVDLLAVTGSRTDSDSDTTVCVKQACLPSFFLS